MNYMKSDALAFIAFPAWQMPFGGHQQTCHGKLSKLPFIHLLPTGLYKRMLTAAAEPKATVDDLLSIKRSRMPVERFEKLSRRVELVVEKRILWLINPHYKQKFGLKPCREVWPFDRITWLRNFYSTSAWYFVRKRQ